MGATVDDEPSITRRWLQPIIGRGKFRHYVICGGCQWMTALSRTEGIAAKLWNEAKPQAIKAARNPIP